MTGKHRARVGLFLDDAQAERAEVPDPYYGGPQGFDDVYALVLDGCALLAPARPTGCSAASGLAAVQAADVLRFSPPDTAR
ncbi:MAG: hypothetical protein R3F43_04975 [bacterium]